MINCRNCINWFDKSLLQIESTPLKQEPIFMGCKIYGFPENNTHLESCAQYVESQNLFTICTSCQITVPKVCVSLGECVNCTDTDLLCIDQCIGGDNRKYCTHFVRLHMEGVHLINDAEAFELFPSIGMPGEKKDGDIKTSSPKRTRGARVPNIQVSGPAENQPGERQKKR